MNRLLPAAPFVLAALYAAAPPPAAAQPDSPYRAYEPVVLEGSDLGPLTGLEPEDLLGFRYEGSSWVQFPIQVDERDLVDLGDAYDGVDPDDCASESYCEDLVGHIELTYWTDPDTHVGPDSDTAFDDDDELVFMARDAAERAGSSTPAPSGTVATSRVEVRLTASEGGDPTYAYLFERSNPSLSSDAGTSYVAYDPVFCDPATFSSSNCDPLTDPYVDTYDLSGIKPGGNDGGVYGDAAGANPEDTAFSSPYFSLHFLDRWILDELRLSGSVDADLIDRHKLGRPNSCARHETTGSRGEGAFVVNRSGPIRAIRAVIGINSGPLTQRHTVLYDRYIDERTYLRVHQLPALMDFFDYATAAEGMAYANNLNTTGVTVDGTPDTGIDGLGTLAWEVIDGTPGTIVTRFDPLYELVELYPDNTYTSVSATNFYEDDETDPESIQCTGDQDALGESGYRYLGDAEGKFPNSDPRRTAQYGELYKIELGRRMALSPTNLSAGAITTVLNRLANPLTVTVNPTSFAGGAAEAGAASDAAPMTRLHAPRPNPMAGRSVVPFELAAAGAVRLAVYDVLGREVAVLHDGALAGGPHEAAFETTGLARGTYLVRLTTPEGTRARTVTLVDARR